jgi:hypothetical protein
VKVSAVDVRADSEFGEMTATASGPRLRAPFDHDWLDSIEQRARVAAKRPTESAEAAALVVELRLAAEAAALAGADLDKLDDRVEAFSETSMPLWLAGFAWLEAQLVAVPPHTYELPDDVDLAAAVLSDPRSDAIADALGATRLQQTRKRAKNVRARRWRAHPWYGISA